jgi:quinol monooxygenase YgiN
MQGSAILIIAELRIAEGQLDQFKSIAEKTTSGVIANEPDTLEYMWYINAKGDICFAIERYPHSRALLTHLQKSGPVLGDLFKVSSVDTVSIYGDVSTEVKEAFAQFPFETQYCTEVIGFSK